MTTSTPRPTEPLRTEHQALLVRLEELGRAAADLPFMPPHQARERVRALVAFLRGHLVPHALAEDRVLYPAVEAAMGAPGATATMSADHVEVVRRIDLLEASTMPGGDLSSVPALLIGLSAILLLHFAKEEQVLLPILDRTLSADEATSLFERMAASAGEAAGLGEQRPEPG